MAMFNVALLILNNPWKREPERGWAYNTENVHIGIECRRQSKSCACEFHAQWKL